MVVAKAVRLWQVWTMATVFFSSRSQYLHQGPVYSGAYLGKDGWSQLQSPPQCFKHLSAVCVWIMQESSVILSTALDKKQREGELCYDGSSNHKPDYCCCKSSFVFAFLEACKRRRKMVALTADTVLFVLFFPPTAVVASHACITLIIPPLSLSLIKHMNLYECPS